MLYFHLLLDTSASMTGAPLAAMRQGVGLLHHAVTTRSNRPALIGAIAYESAARVLFPPADVRAMPHLPPLEAAGSSGLGAAFRLLADTLHDDHPALVYIFTDGEPTDDWETALARLRPKVEKIYGIACGIQANIAFLSGLSDQAFALGALTDDVLFTTFRAYI